MKKSIVIFLLIVAGCSDQDKISFKDDMLLKSQGISGNIGYSQGGIIVDGIAFFTGDRATYDTLWPENDQWDGFPFHRKAPGYHYVVAFNAETLELLTTYPFEYTSDSTPLVIQQNTGRWLILAHEHEQFRTSAYDLLSKKLIWRSEPNQPGQYFFGYSYYRKKDGTILVLTESDNGLHAVDLDTGKDQWWIERSNGMTPAVDQENGFVYFQSDTQIDKIDAETGEVVSSSLFEEPCRVYSGNTMLMKDAQRYYISTFCYEPDWGSSLSVYDKDLNFVWKRDGLAQWQKTMTAYHDGKIFIGSGDGILYKRFDPTWKKDGVSAFRVEDGSYAWILDLSDYDYECACNIIYANGVLIVEEQGPHYQIWILNPETGQIMRHYNAIHSGTSCAPPAFSGGRLYSGNLMGDFVEVTQIGQGSFMDWPGAFGDLQTNTMEAPAESLIQLDDPFSMIHFEGN